MGFGGKGANQAVMAARLGARVSMRSARSATTSTPAMTLDNLTAQGVDATHVARVAGSSGVAPIWVEPDGTNRIIVVGGANDAVDPLAAAAAVRTLTGVVAVVGQVRDPAGRDCGRLLGGTRGRRRRAILNPGARGSGARRQAPDCH